MPPVALAPGTRLGPYEISAQIGVGGMGEVYRATDTQLKRAVAIKVLPDAVATDPERLARFQREAEVLASLNHPNIAQIYGLERSSRQAIALVMELVEGPTLAERIGASPLPVDEALAIARQIAESLEAAHEQGIVHRDLKPANVKVREDGTVKVLDFGLAKALEPASTPRSISPSSMTLSPTITTPAMTQVGFILGSAAYMSPEQARGRAVDRRADIWAFGCVLFEMLSGKRAFDADDVSLTLARVLERDVDLSALPPTVPPRVRQVIAVCLRKDPRQRLQSMGDVRLALEGAFETTTAAPSPVPQQRPLWLRALPTAAVAAVAAAIIGFLLQRPDPPPQVMRFQVHAPQGSALPLGTPAISQDGRMLAYTVIDADGVTRIHVRPIDRVETRVLPDTEGAVHPFWSPDGRSLAFASTPSNLVKRVDVDAGSPRTILQVGGPWQGTWNQQGTILVTRGNMISRVSADGGDAAMAARLDTTKGEFGLGFPEFLSDGQRFLFRTESEMGGSINLASLGSPERSLVLDKVDSAPLVARTPRGRSYLLFLRAPDLMAQEFDEPSGTLRGTPTVLVADIGQVANPPVRPTVGVSPSGILAYQTGGVGQSSQLIWVDRAGVEVSRLAPAASVQGPRLSPDGEHVAGVRFDIGAISLWSTDLRRGASTRLTFGGTSRDPVWSPDGTRLALRRTAPDAGIFVIARDGSNQRRVAEATAGRITSWSPDGRYLAAYTQGVLTLVPVEGTEKPLTIQTRNGRLRFPEFSPSGKFIAFVSDESGRDEVYVQPVPPASGTRVNVSVTGGVLPQWRRDGRELFFLSSTEGNGAIMSVDVQQTGDVFSAGVPRLLFRAARPSMNTGYAVRADGQQVLIPAPENVADGGTPINVVVNWWVELERAISSRADVP
jgi:eukaryotic-like serine/threonine-protein kinase